MKSVRACAFALSCLFFSGLIVRADHRHFDDAALHAVTFIDAKEGWAVGDEGVVWHTIDAGKTWYRQATGTRATLRSVCFLTPQIGWIVGREELPGGQSAGVLLFTDDRGLHWRRGLVNALPGLNKVRFADSKTGFLLGDCTERLPSGVFKTTNGGRNWRPVAGPRTSSWNDGDFQNGETGAVAGMWSRLFVLRRGELVQADVDDLGGRNVNGLRVWNGRGVAVGDGGLLLTSATNGKKWGFANFKLSAELLTDVNFHAVCAAGDHVWAVGSPGSVVLHSPDGGQSWELQKTKQSLPLYDVHFRDQKNGFAVGALGTILRTTDGGANWNVQRSGGKRAAVIFANAHNQNIPLSGLAKLGLDDGYLAVAVRTIAADPKTATREAASDNHRFTAAVRRAGGALGEPLWQFPLPQHFANSSPQKLMEYWNKLHNASAAKRMLRQFVLALRVWRPDVVVTDDPLSSDAPTALVAEALRRAGKLASDPSAFPEQIRSLGLQPHRVSRIYSSTVNRHHADATIDCGKLSRRLGGSPRDIGAAAATMFGSNAPVLPLQRQFKLVESTLPGAGNQLRLMGGVTLKSGDGARRKLAALRQPDTRFAKALKARRQLQILAANPSNSLANGDRLAAELGRVLKQLPADQGASAAYSIASGFARRGQWALAREVFETMTQRYPIHPLTADAYRWLVRHNTSSEVRRRYELKQFVLMNHAEAVAPRIRLPQNQESTRQLGNLNDRPLPGSTTNRKPKRLPDIVKSLGQPLPQDTRVKSSGKFTYLRNEHELRRWHEASLKYVKQLEAFGSLYSHDPKLQFCLQSARRQLGQLKETEEWFKNYQRSAAVRDSWWKAAAVEAWLAYPNGLPPKAVLTCRRTNSRPFLDGQFDDPCWQGRQPELLSKGTNADRKTHHTEVRFAYDREFLYVALRCTHPAEFHVAAAKKRPRDADLRKFDRVSILLDLDRDYSTYFHFQVDQRGCVFEDCWGDKKWNPRWFVAVRSTKTSWHIEAAIPLAELTGDPVALNSAWACNVVRILPGRGVQAVSTPAGVQSRPEGMGLLIFRDAPSRPALRPASQIRRIPADP